MNPRINTWLKENWFKVGVVIGMLVIGFFLLQDSKKTERQHLACEQQCVLLHKNPGNPKNIFGNLFAPNVEREICYAECREKYGR